MTTEEEEPLLLRALRRAPVPRTPLWVMRQAGRYLPEYREARRAAGDFLTLLRTPERAAEVTLQPLRRFALDAAVVFSDILALADAWGLGFRFREGEGPRLERPIATERDLDNLPSPESLDASLAYVYETVRLVVRELSATVPLVGFAASPWTLACYALGGGGDREFTRARVLIHRAPHFAERLLERFARDIARHVALQAAAGARVAMIFDTWGGLLDEGTHTRLVLPVLRRLVEEFRSTPWTRSVPLVFYTRGGSLGRFRALAACGFDALGIDGGHALGEVHDGLGGRCALQGNLDPYVLYAEEEGVRREATRLLEEYGTRSGHVFNLAQGILPDIDPGRVAVLVETVREVSTRIRSGGGT